MFIKGLQKEVKYRHREMRINIYIYIFENELYSDMCLNPERYVVVIVMLNRARAVESW